MTLRPDTTTRVSVQGDGSEGNGISFFPSLNADGTVVAFRSAASNLVPGDTNDAVDIFVRDLVAGTNTRVSVNGDGVAGDDHSGGPSISADGTVVAFSSSASNLVPGDTNGEVDVFVRDLAAGTTTRVSVQGDGAEGDGRSFLPSISANGAVVAFRSFASNLVPGDTNGSSDVFVRDLVARTTTLVSVGSSGAEGDANSAPSISGDGTMVAFSSLASNLAPGDTNGFADAFVRDLVDGTITRASVDGTGVQGDGHSFLPFISADGTAVAFFSRASNLVPGDTNGSNDVFVHAMEPTVPGTAYVPLVPSRVLDTRSGIGAPGSWSGGRR